MSEKSRTPGSRGDSPLHAFMSSFLNRYRRYLLAALSLVLFVMVWHLVSWWLTQTDPILAKYIPYPADVGRALLDSFVSPVPGPGHTMGTLILASLQRVLLGFAIALGLALPLGLLMGAFRTVEDLGKPIVEIIRPIPPIAWVPVFMFALKSFWGPVAIVFLGAFFPILINVIFGVKSVDQTLLDAAKTLGAKRRALFEKVIVPFTLPYLMTGVKVGFGIAWMCIVAAEMLPVTGGGGLGYAIWSTADISRYDYTYAAMIVIGILSMATTGLASQVEERVYKWMGMK